MSRIPELRVGTVRRLVGMRRKKQRTVGSPPTPRRHPDLFPAPRPRPTGRLMTLWTFCQSVLLTFNAFAILNEQRFLEKCGLGQSSLTSGYVSATSPRGQLIGLITATQYMRGASCRRSGRSCRRSRARPSRRGSPRFLGTGRPTAPENASILGFLVLFFFRRRVVVRLSSPRRHSADPQRAPSERSAAGRDERAGDLREDGVRLNHEVDIIRS